MTSDPLFLRSVRQSRGVPRAGARAARVQGTTRDGADSLETLRATSAPKCEIPRFQITIPALRPPRARPTGLGFFESPKVQFPPAITITPLRVPGSFCRIQLASLLLADLVVTVGIPSGY